MDGGNLGIFRSLADQPAGHGECFLIVACFDGCSESLNIAFACPDPWQQWIQIHIGQIDHPFGRGGGVGRWRVTQYFCGSGVEGMEPAGGQFATVAGPVFFAGLRVLRVAVELHTTR